MKNIAIFASGGGSNFKEIYKKINLNEIPANISLVISNNPNCGAIKFAEKESLPNFIINKQLFSGQEERTEMLKKILINCNIDLICLAGYMKRIPEKIINHFKFCILNIHPSLLPKFGGKGYYGIRVHQAVVSSNEKETGATVHFVDNKYDNGPIILQKKIKISSEDSPESISDKVLLIEHEIYPKVVKAFCEDRIRKNINNNKLEVIIEN